MLLMQYWSWQFSFLYVGAGLEAPQQRASTSVVT